MMGSTFNQTHGTLSLGQWNPCYEKLSQCSSGGQLDVLVSADRGAEHASDEGKTPCTCLTQYASGLSLFDIPLRHCSCPKV